MISVDAFTGEYPRMLPHLLPAGGATEAVDCDFAMGALAGIVAAEPVARNVPENTRTLYVHDSAGRNLYYWDRDVEVVRGPVADDRFDRFYWLDSGVLYVSNGNVGNGEPTGSNKYQVGVPFPAVAAQPSATAIDVSSATFSITKEDASGVVLFPLIPLSAQIASNQWYNITLRLTGNYASLAQEAKGSYVINIDMPAGRGVIRQPGALLPSSMPGGMMEYTASFIVHGDHIAMTFSPNTRTVVRREYVYTYVNEYGEESAPSEPGAIDMPESGAARIILVGHANDTGHCPISRIRLYRAETGSQGTAFFFHSEHANAPTVTVEDTTPGENLFEPLSTRNNYPPETGLETLAVMANGMLVASKGNQLFVSEQYLPYAWNPENVQVALGRIVGLCAAEGGMYVTTTSHPYFLSGTTPDACTLTKITSVQAGVSRRSICNVGDFVVWASHDGLVFARGATASMDWSHKFFTREAWRAMFGSRLSAMRLHAHDGNLLIWFADGSQGMLVRFDGEELSMTRLTLAPKAVFVDPLGDALVVFDGAQLLEFKGAHRNERDWGSRSAFSWKSKNFILPRPSTFGLVRLLGRGSVSFAVLADGEEVHREQVVFPRGDNVCTFRLPAGFLARVWGFAINGSAESMIESVRIATSASEVKSG